MAKSDLFSRGYDRVREKVGKGSKYTMSCYNCEYFYQTSEDSEELCQNPNVLKYDMVITPTNIYCNRWRLSKRETKTTFRGGAELVGRKKAKQQETRRVGGKRSRGETDTSKRRIVGLKRGRKK